MAGVVGVLALVAGALYIIISRRRWQRAQFSSRSSAWVSDLENAPIDHKVRAPRQIKVATGADLETPHPINLLCFMMHWHVTHVHCYMLCATWLKAVAWHA